MTRRTDSNRIGVALMAGLLVACVAPSPNPSAGDASASPSASSVPSEPAHAPVGSSWVQLQIQPPGGPGDLVIQGLYAGPEGIVATGQLSGALAEQAGGTAPVAWHSSDGSSWSPSFVNALPAATGEASARFGAIFERDGQLMAFRTGEHQGFGTVTNLMQSPDGGRSWRSVDGETGAASGNFITDVARGGPGFVAVGYTPDAIRGHPVILVSTDGLDWATPAGQVRFEGDPPYGYFNAVAWNGTLLVAGGSTRAGLDGRPDGHVWTSTDGFTWTKQGQPTEVNADVWDVAAFRGGFVAVGRTESGPAAWSSVDGSTWERADLPSLATVRAATSVARVSDGLIAVGDGFGHAVAWHSSDGRKWEPAGPLTTGPGSALLVVGLETGALVVGGSTAPAEPLAWVSPPSIARLPAPETTFPLDASPAPVTGEIPGPTSTPWPNAVPLPAVTLGDLTKLAGSLGMTCQSGIATIPDFPLTNWGLYCQVDVRNTQVDIQASYWNPQAIGDFMVGAFPIDNATAPDQPLVDAVMTAAVRLPYAGNSFRGDPAAWIRSRLYRAECVSAINCIWDDGSVQIVLQLGAYGGARVQVAASHP